MKYGWISGYIFAGLNLNFRIIIVAWVFLSLSQKTGAGLFLHKIFHNRHYQPALPLMPENNPVKFACNCIDDFTLPFLAAGNKELLSIAAVYPEHIFSGEENQSGTAHQVTSLRAPPGTPLYL